MIVIDSGCFGKILGVTTCKAFEFLQKSIMQNDIQIAVGGSKYEKEIKTASLAALKVYKALLDGRRVQNYKNSDVDVIQKKIEDIGKIHKLKNFDDPHIVALLIMSKAAICCSHDGKMHKNIPFFFNGSLPWKISEEKINEKGKTEGTKIPVCRNILKKYKQKRSKKSNPKDLKTLLKTPKVKK